MREEINVSLEKYDDCCYLILIKDAENKEIATGIWCPESHIVAVDGETIGRCATKEEVVARLGVVEVPKYRLRSK